MSNSLKKKKNDRLYFICFYAQRTECILYLHYKLSENPNPEALKYDIFYDQKNAQFTKNETLFINNYTYVCTSAVNN